MLVIKKDFKYEEFESALASVRSESRLRLPSQLSHVGYWGVEVALIQLLITWSKVHKNPIIKTYINDGEDSFREKQLGDFGQRLYGIAALYLTQGMTTGQDSPIPRNEYAGYCSEVLKSMNQCDIYSPDSVNSTYPRRQGKVAAQFICLHNTRYEFIRALYNSPSQKDTITRTDFSSLIRSAFSAEKVFARHLKIKPIFGDHLSNLIYELFQNTNDHAYEDLEGKPFEKNIRALSLKSHSDMMERKDLSHMESINPRFNEYLDFCSDVFTNAGLKTHRFIEISVIDGGLGLAQKFTSQTLSNLSLDKEKKVTEECFEYGITSKDSQS